MESLPCFIQLRHLALILLQAFSLPFLQIGNWSMENNRNLSLKRAVILLSFSSWAHQIGDSSAHGNSLVSHCCCFITVFYFIFLRTTNTSSPTLELVGAAITKCIQYFCIDTGRFSRRKKYNFRVLSYTLQCWNNSNKWRFNNQIILIHCVSFFYLSSSRLHLLFKQIEVIWVMYLIKK